MSKNGNEQIDADNVEYGFIILKENDGAVKVQPFDDSSGISKPPTFDDIHNACQTVCRNIEIQQTAQAISQGMIAVAEKMQVEGGKKTEGGVVLPS